MALDAGLVGRSYPPSAVYEVGREKIAEFATALGDPDPVYRDPAAARAAGLPDVIAHGMLTAGIAARAVTGWAGDPGAVVDYQVRFSRPVVVPDDDAGAELTVRGRVAAVGEDGRVRVDLTVTSNGDKVLSLARAFVALS